MPTVASILMKVMTFQSIEQRRTFLEENPVQIIQGTLVHRIAGFDRQSATWKTFCGISYEGDGHTEEVPDETTNCMMCAVGHDR